MSSVWRHGVAHHAGGAALSELEAAIGRFLEEGDEADEILDIFTDLLRGPTGDGQNKRRAGTKVNWKVDRGHLAAFHRHVARALNHDGPDEDSGCNPWVHVAWRALALAWQEDERAKTLGERALNEV